MPVQKIRERPILFSAPMVRAILEGRKTQTRRMVKNEFGVCAECFASPITAVPHNEGDGGMGIFGDDPYLRVAACSHAGDLAGGRTRCPYGVPGERLWVKETFAAEREEQAGTGAVRWTYVDGWEKKIGALYRADGIREYVGRWRPSIHMPRCLSRIDLEVTGVRIEKLHAITEADATAEGCTASVWETWTAYDPDTEGYPSFFIEPTAEDGIDPATVKHHRSERTALFAFERLWRDINGGASWDANPWVWVVEFKRVRP